MNDRLTMQTVTSEIRATLHYPAREAIGRGMGYPVPPALRLPMWPYAPQLHISIIQESCQYLFAIEILKNDFSVQEQFPQIIVSFSE